MFCLQRFYIRQSKTENAKGKTISFAFLEILDLAMQRKQDWKRVQLELQEKISKYKKKARRTKVEEKNSSRVLSIKFWGPQKPWPWKQNCDSSPKKNASYLQLHI